MRVSTLCLAAVLTLSACAATGSPAPGPTGPRTARGVRVYTSLPRCPVREVGQVGGASFRAIQSAAMQFRADAVILDRQSPNISGPRRYTGVAVVFVREDCRR